MTLGTHQRVIMHVDMDAFYASIEQRDNQELRGKPVVVGGSGSRGVVAAASYEVRKFGVHSAMPGREAKRRCPDAIFVKPRIDHYREVSRQIFAIFKDLTPTYEGLSLDEAFLDFSNEIEQDTQIQQRALLIKQRIFETTGLTASIGVGPNKLVAKIASDLNKPNGLCVLFGDQISLTLDPMSASKLPGVGKKTALKLRKIGVHTIKDLRTAPDAAIAAVFGRYAMRIKQKAGGIDDRAVMPFRKDKSISAETTFNDDLEKHEEMMTALTSLADRTAQRARVKSLLGSVIAVKIRTSDFRTYSRQMKLTPPSNTSAALKQQAQQLLEEWQQEHAGQAVRLLGVGISGLRKEKQLDLFGETQKEDRKIDQVLDSIKEKYGNNSVKRGNRLR